MKKIVIVLVLVVLVLFGCKGKTGIDIPTITTKDLYQGTDGLELGFVEDNPPDEVYEQSYTAVVLSIGNKGAYEIKGGVLALALEDDYMRMLENSFKSVLGNVQFKGESQLEFDLKGKEINSPEGSEDQITFLVDILALEEMSIYHDSSIIVTGCYKYKTQLSDQICIDTDLFGTRLIEKPCEVKTKSFSDQGAPVAITGVEVSMLPDLDNDQIRPQITIQIMNKGNGEVLVDEKNTIRDACTAKSLDFDKFNKVDVRAVMGENKILDCHIEGEGDSPTKVGIATLKDKKAKIRCVFEEGISIEEGTRLEPLYIELDYGYTTSVAKTIKINKVEK